MKKKQAVSIKEKPWLAYYNKHIFTYKENK